MKSYDLKADFLRQLQNAREGRNSDENFSDPKQPFLEAGQRIRDDFQASGILEIFADKLGLSNAMPESFVDKYLPTEFINLRNTGNFYEEEASKAFEIEAFFAASVMSAAALESTLMMIAFTNQTSVTKSILFTQREYRQGRPSVLNLNFAELIDICVSQSWMSQDLTLPLWKAFINENRGFLQKMFGSRSLPVDPSHLLLRFLHLCRNYIHPNRFVKASLSAVDARLQTSFYLAALSYLDLRDNLLVKLSKDAHLLEIKDV